MSLVVKSKTKDVVKCEVIDGGELKSRRHLNVRGKSATLPSITGLVPSYCFVLQFFVFLILMIHIYNLLLNLTEKDWEDIKFGVDNQVDFYAVSFVKDAKVIHELKDYLKSKLPGNYIIYTISPIFLFLLL